MSFSPPDGATIHTGAADVTDSAVVASLPRDGRIDFIRGFACLAFITAHFEAFTWLHMVFWERLGFFSGAEVFVLLSGFLTGIVHRRVFLQSDGAERSLARLWRRAGTLYLAYVVLTLLVILAGRFTSFDMTAVSTFTDHSKGVTYRLIPPPNASIGAVMHNVLLLRTTPHQVQILGLYCVLLGLTPFALVLLRRAHPYLCITLSLCAWALNQLHPMQPTGALFENAFPLLAWQLYFFLALVAGWYRGELLASFDRHPKSAGALWTLIALIALASLVFAQATGNPAFPAGTRLPIVSPDTFRAVHQVWFEKNPAQAGRVLCAVAFTISFYRLLGVNWHLVDHLFGRVLVPLGQSSLYVFLAHVPLIAVVDQLPGYFDRPPGYSPDTVWVNTLVLCALIATIWLMVRNKVLFGIIPR